MNKPLAPTPLTPGARSMDEEAAALQKEREEATKPPFLALGRRARNLCTTLAARKSSSIGEPKTIRR